MPWQSLPACLPARAARELRVLFEVVASVVAVITAYQFDRRPQLRRPRNVGEKGYGRFFSLTARRRARRRRSQLFSDASRRNKGSRRSREERYLPYRSCLRLYLRAHTASSVINPSVNEAPSYDIFEIWSNYYLKFSDGKN